MGIIDEIYQEGDDALASQFEVNIAPLAGVIESTGLKFRVQTFDSPEDSLGTYEIAYKGTKITKPNFEDTTPKTFSFDIRLDKQYAVYKKFKDWLDLIKNPDTGEAIEDLVPGSLPSYRTSIIVNMIDASKNILDLVDSYTGCFPISVGGRSYDQSSQEPIVVPITMAFLKKITS